MPTEKLSPTLYMEHVPDTYTEDEIATGADWPLGAGFFDIGVEVNGAKFPLARVKGGAVQKQLDLAKAANGKDTATKPA